MIPREGCVPGRGHAALIRLRLCGRSLLMQLYLNVAMDLKDDNQVDIHQLES